MLKYVIRLFTILLFLAAGIFFVYLSTENRQLSAEVNQLAAELGRMSIKDKDRVYFVEIEKPEVPPEVASRLKRIWQFRCYFPPGYDFIQGSSNGRVSQLEIYNSGGSSTSWGTSSREATHKLVSVSVLEKDNRPHTFYSITGSGGSTTFGSGFSLKGIDGLVVQKLVSSKKGPRSFDQDTILPLLKLYDPSTEEDSSVAGKPLKTYAGGMILICPKSRESDWKQLQLGEQPRDFDPNWLATAVVDE